MVAEADEGSVGYFVWVATAVTGPLEKVLDGHRAGGIDPREGEGRGGVTGRNRGETVKGNDTAERSSEPM